MRKTSFPTKGSFVRMIPFPYPPGSDDATKLRITQVYRELCDIAVRNERQAERITQIQEKINIEQEKYESDLRLKKELEKELRMLAKIPDRKKSNIHPWFWIAMAITISWTLYNLLK